MKKSEIDEAKRAIEWKANLYALAAEVMREAEQGDPLALSVRESVMAGHGMAGNDIDEAKRAIEFKENLYALCAEVIRDAEQGDPLALRILASTGLNEPLRLVTNSVKSE